MPVTTVENTRLRYQAEGNEENPALILSHALGTDLGMWAPQMADLLRSFRVLRYDTRGLGSSDAPPGDYSIEQLGRDVLALADSLQIRRFAFLGLSLGGMIGQWLGASAPGRLTALVLANTTPYAPPKSNWDERRRAVLEGGMPAIVDAALGRFFSPETRAQNPPVVEAIRATILATNPAGYASCCAAIREMDHRDLLPKIAVPTLVIGGDRDVSTPWPAHGEIIARAIPHAKTVHLDAAHLSNIEQPQAFNAAVIGFLSSDARR